VELILTRTSKWPINLQNVSPRCYRSVFLSSMLSRSSTLSMLVGRRALASLRAADMSSTPPMDAALMTQMMANDSRSLARTLSMPQQPLSGGCHVWSVRSAALPYAAAQFLLRLRLVDRQQVHCQSRWYTLPLPYSTRDASESTFNRLRDRSSCVTKPSTRVPIGWPGNHTNSHHQNAMTQ
jgi:hypothetical protein